MILLVSALLANQSIAANYYVRVTGSGANAGSSPASAWRTIQHAADTLSSGDTVYVGAGSYVEKVRITSGGGTSSNPTKYIADTDGSNTGDAGVVRVSYTSGGTYDDVVRVDGPDYFTGDRRRYRCQQRHEPGP